MDMEPEQEIENRSVRSGASKRKKRKEQLDEWNRLQSKLPSTVQNLKHLTVLHWIVEVKRCLSLTIVLK